jgi:protein-tyrosine-phosphatase
MAASPPLTLSPPDFLKLLAHELRWELLGLLAQSDYRVQELVERVGRPINLVSYHLAQLRQGRLVSEHRSSEDGRDIYYRLELERISEMYAASGTALHPAVGVALPLSITTLPPGAPARVLFLCTHNSARSQMAEALLRRLGGARVEVYSAGTIPSTVHPLTISTLAELGIDAGQPRSKHMDEFGGQRFDYIITVCDRVREQCPIFPGDPVQSHWSFADPAAVAGTEAAQRSAFAETARQIGVRVRHLLLVLEHGAHPA